MSPYVASLQSAWWSLSPEPPRHEISPARLGPGPDDPERRPGRTDAADRVRSSVRRPRVPPGAGRRGGGHGRRGGPPGQADGGAAEAPRWTVGAGAGGEDGSLREVHLRRACD